MALPRDHLSESELFRDPFSLDPMPDHTRRGLYAVGSMALLSVVTTAALLIWITWRLIFWKRHYRSYIGYNQNVILIYQLLLADLQQSLGFMFSFHWISQGKIIGPAPVCFAQAWFIHLGDVSSGFFVLLIAIHTWLSVVRGRRLPYNWFVAGIIATWAVSLLLTVLGPAIHGRNIFLRAGSWCWIASNHETARLTLHYLWIFIDEFGTIITYAVVFWHLRRNFTSLVHSQMISKATRCMVLYPLAYVVLTLPLATGRMANMNGHKFPDDYYVVAGGLITSCGWVDCLLYSMTRRVLITSELHPSGEPSTTHRPSGYWRTRTRPTTDYVNESNAAGSTDSIINDAMRLGDIKAETKVEVTISDASTIKAAPGAYYSSEIASHQDPTTIYSTR